MARANSASLPSAPVRASSSSSLARASSDGGGVLRMLDSSASSSSSRLNTASSQPQLSSPFSLGSSSRVSSPALQRSASVGASSPDSAFNSSFAEDDLSPPSPGFCGYRVKAKQFAVRRVAAPLGSTFREVWTNKNYWFYRISSLFFSPLVIFVVVLARV